MNLGRQCGLFRGGIQEYDLIQKSVKEAQDYFVTTISLLRGLSPNLLTAVTAKTCEPGVSFRRVKFGLWTVPIRFQKGGWRPLSIFS